MDIKRQHDFFTDSLHLLLRLHTENPGVPLVKLVYEVLAFCDPNKITDEQFAELLEDALDDYKQLDNYEE
jgi:hypothetical protein